MTSIPAVFHLPEAAMLLQFKSANFLKYFLDIDYI